MKSRNEYPTGYFVATCLDPSLPDCRKIGILSSQRRLGSSHIAILQEVKYSQETLFILGFAHFSGSSGFVNKEFKDIAFLF